MADDWCLIESDPAVFTEMLETLGCSTVELQELWSLEPDILAPLKDICYGLIFLFQWKGETQQEHADSKQPLEEDSIPPNLFFAQQVATNACATQAVLSVVFNAANAQRLSGEQLGKTLTDFHEVATEFPPNLKGMAIASSEEIKKAHNSFAATDSFLNEGKHYDKSDKGEAFHFVAYVPVNGTVYELDGLQRGPIVVGDAIDDWLKTAASAIQDRMIQIGADSGHVKFNLMAVTQDKRIELHQRLTETPDDHDLMAAIQQEDMKREQWKLENQRRRHNFVPLAVRLLQELARIGTLPDLVAAAQEKQAEKRRVAQQQNKAMG